MYIHVRGFDLTTTASNTIFSLDVMFGVLLFYLFRYFIISDRNRIFSGQCSGQHLEIKTWYCLAKLHLLKVVKSKLTLKYIHSNVNIPFAISQPMIQCRTVLDLKPVYT